jgi:SAM-dependent methyltransferase
MDKTIYLPAGIDQFNHLKANTELSEKSILLIGANTEIIGKQFLDAGAKSVAIIIDDYDLLIKARLAIDKIDKISVKFMEYTKTDFEDASFDIVYAQGSISNSERNKILKETRRVLKPKGIMIAGEYVSLKAAAPNYVNDVWESGNISPLKSAELATYYKAMSFDVINVYEHSTKLKDFYESIKKLLNENIDQLTEQEKSYYKKLLKRINHESNVYLKLGGSDYMGFSSIIVRKNS